MVSKILIMKACWKYSTLKTQMYSEGYLKTYLYLTRSLVRRVVFLNIQEIWK